MKWAITPILFSLAACTVGPNYEQPQLATPAAFQDLPQAGAAPLSQPAGGDADLTQWWQQFHDAELERLVTRALAANLDLMSTASLIRQAREQEIVQGAAGLPSVNATGSAVRLHSNTNPLATLGGGGGPAGAASSSGGSDLRLYSAGFDASWEIDVFGGVRRGVEAARDKSDAAVWQLRDGEVSLSAEVANDYLMLRAAEARIALLQSALQRQRETLAIVQARATVGFVTELDVDQQTAQVEATAAQLPPLAAQRLALVHALGVLLGEQPETMEAELQATGAIPAVPATLPVGLPSDLLRRRPDVRQAERNLAAATAQVGVAVAQLYPKFNLLGLASFASNSLNGFFSSDNFSAAGLGLIRWPIFTAGKSRANVRISEEQQNQAYLGYRQSVLKALQDAEDSLTRYTNEQQRLVSLQNSIAAATSSYAIATDQYRSGLVTYLNVLTAETALLNAQDEAAQSRAALSADLVSLYKALGGGWSA
ncbi:MAG TPA: efflux transporter outer membrane subunit [Micropepsaceae bacterium]|jgi:NodT family efflux transporter outer membrane factor (OMF) lipoprotein|nr:efflux transporter outer membrane subunit [Micropepsaceae bacterium]